MNYSFYNSYVKPFADLLLASVLLLLALPVFIPVAVLLLIFQGRSIFFTQWRPGKNEQLFLLLKFKTMSDAIDAEGNLLPDEKRITPIGKFIRQTSLDELPQLINILRGEMSFIGPRPLLPDYLIRYSPEQRKRHLIKPGITGWAQVNGRNSISWQKKFEMDIWYVHHVSFAVDMKILLKTVVNVLKRKDINEDGIATASPFLGND